MQQWLVLSLSLYLAGCGACQQVKQNRDAFQGLQEATEAPRGHHIVIAMPKALIDSHIDKAFKAMPSTSFKMPGLGDLNRYMKGLKFKARKLGLDFDKEKAARIRLDLDAYYGRSKLFGLDLAAEAPIIYDAATQTTTLKIRYDIFKTVKPNLSKGAADQLTRVLKKQLPSMARALFPTSTVRKYARRGLNSLIKNLYPMIREKMLKPMGEITRFRFRLPDVPIERISMLSTPSTWQLGVRTSLAADGLEATDTKLKSNQVRFAISSDALAKLGNWAMAKGKIPSAYNRKGKPDKKGDFVAGFGWDQDRSPLKVKMWTRNTEGASTCLFVQAGAKPVVALKGKRIKVGFKDGRIEDVIGPPFIKQALDLMGISKRVLSFSKSIAMNQNIRVGSADIGLNLVGAQFTNTGLEFDLRMADPKPKKKKLKKKKPKKKKPKKKKPKKKKPKKKKSKSSKGKKGRTK